MAGKRIALEVFGVGFIVGIGMLAGVGVTVDAPLIAVMLHRTTPAEGDSLYVAPNAVTPSISFHVPAGKVNVTLFSVGLTSVSPRSNLRSHAL